MTKNKECGEENCMSVAIKEIEIDAYSYFTDRNYKMWVPVCGKHYTSEKNAKSIQRERLLN